MMSSIGFKPVTSPYKNQLRAYHHPQIRMAMKKIGVPSLKIILTSLPRHAMAITTNPASSHNNTPPSFASAAQPNKNPSAIAVEYRVSLQSLTSQINVTLDKNATSTSLFTSALVN